MVLLSGPQPRITNILALLRCHGFVYSRSSAAERGAFDVWLENPYYGSGLTELLAMRGFSSRCRLHHVVEYRIAKIR